MIGATNRRLSSGVTERAEMETPYPQLADDLDAPLVRAWSRELSQRDACTSWRLRDFSDMSETLWPTAEWMRSYLAVVRLRLACYSEGQSQSSSMKLRLTWLVIRQLTVRSGSQFYERVHFGKGGNVGALLLKDAGRAEPTMPLCKEL